jgi:hypothetical protein
VRGDVSVRLDASDATDAEQTEAVVAPQAGEFAPAVPRTVAPAAADFARPSQREGRRVMRCRGCGLVGPPAAFARDASKRGGRATLCGPCDRLKGRTYYDAHREAVLARHRVAPRELVCANRECGRTFTARRSTARVCSKRCRDRVRYLRRVVRAA